MDSPLRVVKESQQAVTETARLIFTSSQGLIHFARDHANESPRTLTGVFIPQQLHMRRAPDVDVSESWQIFYAGAGKIDQVLVRQLEIDFEPAGLIDVPGGIGKQLQAIVLRVAKVN